MEKCGISQICTFFLARLTIFGNYIKTATKNEWKRPEYCEIHMNFGRTSGQRKPFKNGELTYKLCETNSGRSDV